MARQSKLKRLQLIDYVILMPLIDRLGLIDFVLSVYLVCPSVLNFNLWYNFWTIRDRDFIFGMHTPLMIPFWMTPR